MPNIPIFSQRPFVTLREVTKKMSQRPLKCMVLPASLFVDNTLLKTSFPMRGVCQRKINSFKRMSVIQNKELTHSFDNSLQPTADNTSVWHGYSNVVMGRKVALKFEDDSKNSPHSPSAVNTPVFRKSCESTGKGDRHEFISETILSAFLQRKFNPDNEHFLIPTIGNSKTDIMFYFYDSEHDILLETKSFGLFHAGFSRLSYASVLALWLALNYQHLCTGITVSMKNRGFRADFLSQLPQNVRDIYRNQLSFGCGNREVEHSEVGRFQDGDNWIVDTSEPFNFS